MATCGCRGKKRYRSLMHAIRGALGASLNHGCAMRPYRCPRGGWHLTRSTREEYEARVRSYRDEGGEMAL